MNVPVKLAGFAGVLAIVVGAAALAGAKVAPLRPAAGNSDGKMQMDAMAVRGLAVSENGLTLDLASRRAVPGEPLQLGFRIADARGETVRDFDVEHTKRMHVILVRRDLTGFQHVHPTQVADGSWRIPATLADAGSYRVFADFSVGDRAYTLGDDIQVDGAVVSHELPAPADVVHVGGFDVRLAEGPARAGADAELSFTVTRDGEPVALQDYLGAKGHLVALRSGDLAFLHVHPDAERLRFDASFPSAGTYRMFLQFQVDGTVHTAAITREVAP